MGGGGSLTLSLTLNPNPYRPPFEEVVRELSEIRSKLGGVAPTVDMSFLEAMRQKQRQRWQQAVSTPDSTPSDESTAVRWLLLR